jgi:hypothetical protein
MTADRYDAPSEDSRGGRPTLLWLALLFLALPVLSFPELFAGQTLYQADISRIHYPYHIMVAGEWLAGRVPLWNPYQHIGIPLLAEPQVSVLSPLGVVFLSPLSPALELSIFILLHMTLGALFALGLGRGLGLSWPAAAVVGLSFGMGGFLMAQVGNTNIMTGAAFLPLVLWALIWALRRRTLWAAALAGVPLALQAVTAQPQVVLYTATVVVGYGGYRLLADWWQRRRAAAPAAHGRASALVTLLLVGVALFSGLMLAAPQLLPTLELQQLSVRSEDRGYDFLTANSLPPIMWLNLIIPGAFGSNVTGFKGGDPFAEDFIYIGLVALALVFFAWGQRRRPDAPFFLLLLLATALLAMGRFTPLYRYVVQYLPGFSLFRIPSRWLMVVNLALAVLAGCGLESLLSRRPSWRRLAPALGVLALLLVGLGLVWLWREPLAAWGETLGDSFYRRLAAAFFDKGMTFDADYLDRLLLRRITWLTIPAALLAFNLVLALLLFAAHAARLLPRRLFAWLLVAALAFDLALAGGTTINPVRPVDWWQQRSGGARYVLENLTTGRVFPLGMGTERAAVINLGQFVASAHRVYSAGGHGSPLMLARHKTFLDEAHPVQQVRLLGVRYLLTEGRMGADAEATFPLVFQDEDSVVYENRQPVPRVFIVHEALAVANAEAALELFGGSDLDPTRTVVIETTEGLPPLPPQSPETPASVEIVAETPQRLTLSADLAQPGFLVLLDTYYPGWVATVDGRRAPIYRADYLVRAVYLPAGSHAVTFVYRPLSFYGGIGLALLMLLAALLLLWRWPQRLGER